MYPNLRTSKAEARARDKDLLNSLGAKRRRGSPGRIPGEIGWLRCTMNIVMSEGGDAQTSSTEACVGHYRRYQVEGPPQRIQFTIVRVELI